jgi:hypothetical protein
LHGTEGQIEGTRWAFAGQGEADEAIEVEVEVERKCCVCTQRPDPTSPAYPDERDRRERRDRRGGKRYKNEMRREEM